MSATLGPWTAAMTGPNMRSYSQPWGVCANSTIVCGCFGDTSGGEPAAKANARLIAAAPDLLEACRDGAELLSAICEVICAANPPPHGVERLEAMRAAIAKATGARL